MSRRFWGEPARIAPWILLVSVVLFAPAGWADSEDAYYRAFYLQEEKGDAEAAAELYAQVEADASAPAEMRAEARKRRAVCLEEVACSDFARLMVPNCLVYLEFNQPGAQLVKLAEMLGLLRNEETVKAGQNVAISPALVTELLGIRGAALGVTGFDPGKKMPIGALVFHPGNVEVVRGLIETALPIAAKPADSIHGYPTYNIEDKVFVTLTSRLVVVSAHRIAIDQVARRLQGNEADSLATNPDIAKALGDRSDALVYFCANFKGPMPLVDHLMELGAGHMREVAMAKSILDPQSLNSVCGKVSIIEETGLALDLAVHLDEGHHNLVFNFFRMPPVDRGTLERIPHGAAGFVAAALNPPSPKFVSEGVEDDTPPPVTILDIGREIFANIVGISAFVIPADGEQIAGQPVPGAAVIMTVNDPAKSEALWTQFLGVACMGMKEGTIEGRTVDIDGTTARLYEFPDDISVYFVRENHSVIISPSRTAISRSLATLNGGDSVVSDPAFRKSIERLSEHTTLAALASPRRCLEIGRKYMSGREVKEIEPFLPMIEETVASASLVHSGSTLQVSALVTGLPRVGPMISQLVMKERNRAWGGNGGHIAEAAAVTAKQKKEPSAADKAQKVWTGFAKLVAEDKHEAATTVAAELGKLAHDDARLLNYYSWALLTEDAFKDQFNPLALKWSLRSNELSEYGNAYFLDTLALARFVTGDARAAVELQEKALAHWGDQDGREEAEASLAKYKEAAQKNAKLQ